MATTKQYQRDYCLVDAKDDKRFLKSIDSATDRPYFTRKPYEAMWASHQKITKIMTEFNKRNPNNLLTVGTILQSLDSKY